MTALIDYLDLLHNAWEVKLLHANRFFTKHTCLIVLCVYPEKYMSPRVRNPELRVLLRTGYITRLKLTFNIVELKFYSLEIDVYNTQEPSFSG